MMLIYTHDDFIFEEARLSTFSKCVIDRVNLAKRGYVSLDNGLHFKCYFCACQNKDNIQHTCRDALANIPIEYRHILRPPSFLKKYTPPSSYKPRGWNGFIMIQYHTLPINETHAFLESRIRSFSNVSISYDIILCIAEAGFYYKEGMITCYHCGVVLHNWKPQDSKNNNNDPWLNHIYWSPECYHVILSKGVNYVYRQPVFRSSIPTPPDINILHKMIKVLPLPRKLIQDYDEIIICRAYQRYYIESDGRFPASENQAILAVEKMMINPKKSKKNQEISLHYNNDIPMVVSISNDTTNLKVNTDIDNNGEEKYEVNLCVCCKHNLPEIVYFGCGHMVCCSRCTLLLSLCPYCNAIITATCRPVR